MTKSRDNADQINILDTDAATGTAITIDSSQNLAIGTTTALCRTHIRAAGSGSGITSVASNTDLFVEDDGNAAIQLGSPNTSNCAIYFSDPESNVSGVINYNHPDDYMALWSAGAERMRINSSGNVGIGTSSPVYKLVTSNGGAEGIEFHPNSGTNAGFIQFYNRSGAAYCRGSYYAEDHRWFTGASEAMSIDSSGHAIIPAGVTLGTAAGVYNAANTLDDYEEGTCTLTIRGGTSEPGILVSGTGYYTKVGNTVHVRAYLSNFDTTGYSGSFTINGLPFTSLYVTAGSCSSYNAITWTGSELGMYASAGAAGLTFVSFSSANQWTSVSHTAAAGCYLTLACTYQTSA